MFGLIYFRFLATNYWYIHTVSKTIETYLNNNKKVLLPSAMLDNYVQMKCLSSYIDLASTLAPPNTTNYRASTLQEFYQRYSHDNQTATQIGDDMHISQVDSIRFLKESCDMIASNLKLLFSNMLIFTTEPNTIRHTMSAQQLYAKFKYTDDNQVQSYYNYILNGTSDVFDRNTAIVLKTIYTCTSDKEALKHLSYWFPSATYQKRKNLLKKAKTILGAFLFGTNYLTVPMGFIVSIKKIESD